MAGLYGEYRHKLDAKGRLTLPSPIRKTLTEETQLAIVPDAKGEFLSVYTAEKFDEWMDSVFEKRGGYDPNSREHLLMSMALRASATPATMDGAGRITLSPKLREAAGIDKDVALVGGKDRFDIWDSARWDETMASLDLGSLLYTS